MGGADSLKSLSQERSKRKKCAFARWHARLNLSQCLFLFLHSFHDQLLVLYFSNDNLIHACQSFCEASEGMWVNLHAHGGSEVCRSHVR